MGGFTFLCKTADVPDDAGLPVERPDRPPLAVFRGADGYYVTDDTCTHGNASLCDGEFDGTVVMCPFHSGGFDIRTGAPTSPPCVKTLKTYPVRVDGDDISAELGE